MHELCQCCKADCCKADNCPQLISFLHHIRYQKPTVDMLNNIFEERILCTEECVHDSIYDSLSRHPDTTGQKNIENDTI